MKRREVVKSLTLSSALLCFPEFAFTNPKEKLPLHIVGLGRFGRNMVRHLQKNNVPAEYTCIYR